MLLSDRAAKEAKRLLDQAIGPEVTGLLERPDTEDVALNPDGRGFVYTGAGRFRLEARFSDETRQQIINLASRFAGIVLDGQRLSFGAELPGRIRFQGGLPPRSVGGAYVVLRALPKHVHSFESYVSDGIAPTKDRAAPEHKEAADTVGEGLPTMDCIAAALNARLTIVVLGETGSGKTSLLASMINHPAVAADRMVCLEDVPEILFWSVDDVLRLSSEGGAVADLLRDALRCRPDRIIIGESRGPEFWHFILAQYTGHGGGLITVHAGSPADFFDRAEHMIAQAGIDPAAQRRVLLKTVHRLVWIRRRPGGGREIVGVFRPTGFCEKQGYSIARVDVPHLDGGL